MDPQGNLPVYLNAKPNIAEIRDLLCNAVSLAHKPLVFFYENYDPPTAWEKIGMLRYHRLIRLTPDGNSAATDFPLVYSPKLGIRFVRLEEVLQ